MKRMRCNSVPHDSIESGCRKAVSVSEVVRLSRRGARWVKLRSPGLNMKHEVDYSHSYCPVPVPVPVPITESEIFEETSCQGGDMASRGYNVWKGACGQS